MDTSNTSLIGRASESQATKGRPRRNTVTFADNIVTHEFPTKEDQCINQTSICDLSNADYDVKTADVDFPAIQVWDIDDSETFQYLVNNLNLILS